MLSPEELNEDPEHVSGTGPLTYYFPVGVYYNRLFRPGDGGSRPHPQFRQPPLGPTE